MPRSVFGPLTGLVALTLLAVGCGGVDVAPSDDGHGGGGGSGTSTTDPSSSDATSTAGPGGPGATTTTATTTTTTTGPGTGGGPATTSQGVGGEGAGTGSGGAGGGEVDPDPSTCDEAAAARTNLGCDFWPTVTANMVWEIFDYALVVTNAGDTPADVAVERNGDPVDEATVAPGDAHTFFLPWVDALKGPDADCNGSITDVQETALVRSGAYHVTSTVPVAVYQFSSIEHSPESGGPPGKDWSDCPGTACGLECLSYTNDASMILPTTSLGTTYRVVAYPSWQDGNVGSFLSIVGIEDDTTVSVDLTALASVTGGDGVAAIATNGTGTISLDRGDVVQLVAAVPGDFSGTLVTANHPVQVISGIACSYVPAGVTSCDHLEESQLPVDGLGSHFLVARPTGAAGAAIAHVVRIVGQTNGTTLTYSGSPPPGAPTTVNAGQLLDLGVASGDFEVQASAPIAIGTYLQGGSVIDPGGMIGDPSQSMAVSVEQFRRRYAFVAPAGWDQTHLDVILPTGATANLDGAPLGGSRTALSAGYDIIRASISAVGDGGHLLEADAPVGLQVIGYGNYSSYQFPGGVRLAP